MEMTFVGDVHSNFSQFVKLTKRKKKTDVFFQVGDFGLFHSEIVAKKDSLWKNESTAITRFINDLKNEKIERFKVPVYFIKGIHEDFTWMNTETLKNLNIHFMEQGTILTVNNQRIGCLGGIWSPIRIKKASKNLLGSERRFFTQEEIDSLITHHDQKPIDILVTHQAATGCLPIRHNVKQEEGSRELRTLLDYIKPKYYFHGHHHHNYARRTDSYPHVIGLGNFGKNKQAHYTLTI